MLLLSAMIGCGIGLSADSWCHRKFVPCYVRLGDNTFLGLLAKHARLETVQTRELLAVGRHTSLPDFGKKLMLVDPDIGASVGLLPDFLPHHRDRSYSDVLFMRRAKILYPHFMIDPRPDHLKVGAHGLISVVGSFQDGRNRQETVEELVEEGHHQREPVEEVNQSKETGSCCTIM